MTRLTKETIKNLPIEVQEDILSTLRVYDDTMVMIVDGNWEVTPHSSITAKPRKIEMIGKAYQEDFYNEEERREILRELNNCEWWG